MVDRRIRCGVAGAGVFGGYHAKKLASLAEAELVGVYDLDAGRAGALAQPLGGAGTDDFDRLLEMSEAVVIATPAQSHADLTLRAVAAGKCVYVEKPLATTGASARALADAAAARGVVLACGHQERLAMGAMGLFDTPERAFRIEAVRRGTPSPRSRDVSCVQDLMIHDLDLALVLAASPVVEVDAVGDYDTVRAGVRFENGLTALLEASREAEERSRTMRVFYATGIVEIDFLEPSFRNPTYFDLNSRFAETTAGRDPLGESLKAFLAAIRGEGSPAATGEAGALAVELAEAVERAAGIV
jgi:predicted dehydrogenase